MPELANAVQAAALEKEQAGEGRNVEHVALHDDAPPVSNKRSRSQTRSEAAAARQQPAQADSKSTGRSSTKQAKGRKRRKQT